MRKKIWAILIVLVFWMMLVFSAKAEAQHRYLGASGARVFQCAKFYSSLEAQLRCVRGDELRAGQLERLGMLDGLSSDRLVRPAGGQYGGYSSYGGNFGYDGGDGYFYPTDRYGLALGTRTRIALKVGGAVATCGGIGKILNWKWTIVGGLICGGIAASHEAKVSGTDNKKAKQEAEAHQAKVRSEAQAERNLAQARAEQVEAASKEQKLLRNRFDASVRLYFQSDDGQIEDLVLEPGQITKVTLLRGSELIIAEVETETGEWIRLEYGSGKIKLPHNSGWEFDPGRS